MEFYPGNYFHIYNQGNNQGKIFFSDVNYIYFLWKMRSYLLPFGDFVAYCLMPNHFHWLFYIRTVELPSLILQDHVRRTRQLWIDKELKKLKVNLADYYLSGEAQEQLLEKHRAAASEIVTLNHAIGTLERTYTRAIIKQGDLKSGSLFRSNCKAKDGWIDEFITLRDKRGCLDYRFGPGNTYAWECFNYIHENPADANLVKRAEEWKYSSAPDYAGLRRGKLCNLELGRALTPRR